jgi:peptide/nickel transport system permease protein
MALSSLLKSYIKEISYWFKTLPMISILCIAPLIIFGVFGPLLYTHDPHVINFSRSLQPPAWIEGGNWSYIIGTDELGRDLFSRMVEGARASLIVALFAIIFSGLIGVSIGLISGFLGGRIDNLLMRITDAWMAIPPIFFLLMLVVLMRQIGFQGLPVIILGITLTMWVPYAQVVRGETISLKERDFIILAKVTGCGTFRILTKHVFPNVLNSIVIIATGMLGGAIMAEAGATFLGVGIQPPNTAWGMLISESITHMTSAWWIPTFAGLALTFTVLGFNLFGDWLRDAMDPRTRQTVK